jgi:hypothetical protein
MEINNFVKEIDKCIEETLQVLLNQGTNMDFQVFIFLHASIVELRAAKIFADEKFKYLIAFIQVYSTRIQNTVYPVTRSFI